MSLAKGKSTACTPRPGCVALYPEYCAAGNGPMLVVPLASLLVDPEPVDQLTMFSDGDKS